MSTLLSMLTPELILTVTACALFLLGCSSQPAVRRLVPIVALAALLAVLVHLLNQGMAMVSDPFSGSIMLDGLARYMRLLTAAVASMLLLLSWPAGEQGTGNTAVEYGADSGEFFGLMLLSVTGLMLVSVANDLIVLFLALELVSIPTYIMVAISRRQAVAQEAGVKYFFLGALSVAVMLFGFTYLYGATGEINFDRIRSAVHGAMGQPELGGWAMMAIVLIILGLAFKMAAFPLHFYAGDVYEGAATPVTAFLAFVPKAAGFVALIRILQVAGGPAMRVPEQINHLLWIMAVVTMSVGNVLGLLQQNVKRVLAYSSIAHSGYMLAGLAAASAAPSGALQGVLFYLAAYGLMNAAAFGVLMLLPSRNGSDSAETYEDLAGQGRRSVGLGLAMAVSCFSLIGLPLTVGFIGKLVLIRPAFQANMPWLVVIIVVNAAVSAGYYLKIVASLFLRPAVGPMTEAVPAAFETRRNRPVLVAILISVGATLLLGMVPPVTAGLMDIVKAGSIWQAAAALAAR